MLTHGHPLHGIGVEINLMTTFYFTDKNYFTGDHKTDKDCQATPWIQATL